MEVRQQVADFLSALIGVYSLLLIGWVLISFALSAGLRIPYARWSSAILDFLRDIAEPYLRIFRRFVPMIGPLDLSPIVGLIALRVIGGVVVNVIAP